MSKIFPWLGLALSLFALAFSIRVYLEVNTEHKKVHRKLEQILSFEAKRKITCTHFLWTRTCKPDNAILEKP